MSARPFQAEDRAAADGIIGAIRCKSDDPFCGADIANEDDARKVILQELAKARASADVARVRREALEEAAAYAEEKLCCHKKEHAAQIRALIDKPGEG